MNCVQFRRAAGADPGHLLPEAVAHRDACPACAEYLRDLLAMDVTVRRALEVPVTDRPAENRRRLAPVAPQRWLALAASVVAGVLVGTVLIALGLRVAASSR